MITKMTYGPKGPSKLKEITRNYAIRLLQAAKKVTHITSHRLTKGTAHTWFSDGKTIVISWQEGM